MGTLIKFELKKILGNRAGMVACALLLAMLVAVSAMAVGVRDYDTGEYVQGIRAQQALRAQAERHAGTLTDERVAADAAVYDRAVALWEQQPELADLGGWEVADDAAITLGLDFWRETGAILTDDYYTEVVGTLDSTNPRATSLREGARARVDGALSQGLWGYHPYTEAEKAYWRSLEDGIAWPLEYGYDHGWDNVFAWKGFSGLAVVAICIALSGVFAGEYRDRTAAIVLPTRRGKRALPVAKVAASFIFTTAYWLLVAGLVIGTRVMLYGADGWNLPLQVSTGMDNPYPLTVGQAVLLSYGLGYLVALGTAAFALIISSRVRTTLPVAAITMSVVFLGVIGLFAKPLIKIAMLTPFTGLSYAYDVMASYAVGPFVADLPTVLVLLYGVMLVVLTPLAVRAFKRHQV